MQKYNFPVADFALIPGSGFAFNSDNMQEIGFVPYLDFLNPGASAVFDDTDGGRYYTDNNGKTIIAFNKRIHPYQGFSPLESVLPVRIAVYSKAKIVMLANASGGLNPDINQGDLCVINNNIILPSLPDFSPEFSAEDVADAGNPYDKTLTQILRECVGNVTGESKFATYAYMTGPAYETAAEVEFLKSLGADIVGMSTAYESLYAALNGLRVAALSIVTNVHREIMETETTHDEVLKESQKKQEHFNIIFSDFLKAIFN